MFVVLFLQETYPSTPPVWFAESEETSITNAVQILSTTEGQNNHVLIQVSVLNVTPLQYVNLKFSLESLKCNFVCVCFFVLSRRSFVVTSHFVCNR